MWQRKNFANKSRPLTWLNVYTLNFWNFAVSLTGALAKDWLKTASKSRLQLLFTLKVQLIMPRDRLGPSTSTGSHKIITSEHVFLYVSLTIVLFLRRKCFGMKLNWILLFKMLYCFPVIVRSEMQKLFAIAVSESKKYLLLLHPAIIKILIFS